jgi:hypothetical protein
MTLCDFWPPTTPIHSPGHFRHAWWQPAGALHWNPTEFPQDSSHGMKAMEIPWTTMDNMFVHFLPGQVLHRTSDLVAI